MIGKWWASRLHQPTRTNPQEKLGVEEVLGFVDMFAHHLKHVKSDIEETPTKAEHIPFSSLADGMDLHNLYFAVRDAIKFIRQQISIS